MARNYIDEVTGYDFLNDFSGSGSEIYTFGNYLCSSYDWSDEAREELKPKVIPFQKELMKNKWCRYFLSELEIGVS